MQLVIESPCSVREYMAGFAQVRNSAPRECPCCGGCLKGHGRRHRWVVSLEGASSVPIQRMACKVCGKTFSLLPRILCAFCQCARSLVARIRSLWQRGLRSMSDVRYQIAVACPSLESRLSLSALYRWADHTT